MKARVYLINPKEVSIHKGGRQVASLDLSSPEFEGLDRSEALGLFGYLQINNWATRTWGMECDVTRI